jgi:hypothetical protein
VKDNLASPLKKYWDIPTILLVFIKDEEFYASLSLAMDVILSQTGWISAHEINVQAVR